MASPHSADFAPEPPTSAHKVIGTLNLIFAGLLLMCGACTAINFVAQAAMQPMVEQMQGQMQESMHAERKAAQEKQLEALKQEAAEASDEADKARIEAEIAELEEKEEAEPPKFDMMAAYRDPQIIGFMWTDLLTALVLNVLLFISGLGLLGAKAWARKLAIWTAVLKIIRLVTIYGYSIAVVVPIYAQKMSESMENMVANIPQKPGGPVPPPMGQTIGAFYGAAMSAGAVMMILFGVIYPIVILWVLTRPKVKAACGETLDPRGSVAVNPLDALLGPLATIEVRRATRPGWLVWVRLLAALPAVGIAVVVSWIWMFMALLDPHFRPSELLIGGLICAEIVQIVLGLLLSPALVAGAIAGEKDRGTLGLLLASRLTAGDIVLGRLAGCLAQVAFPAAAGLPGCILLAAYCRAGLLQTLLLAGLPIAVAIGSGGLTMAASTLSRRGRDALLTVYLIEVLLVTAVLAASFGSAAWLAWIAPLDPFATVYPLASAGITGPAALTIGIWLLLGACGAALAVWQLRPAFRRQTGGSTGTARRLRRYVPAMADRPMLWKELYLDSAGTFGAFGLWLTRLLVALLTGGGLSIVAVMVWRLAGGDQQAAPWCDSIAELIDASSMLLVWLVQWMIGLKALGLIGTERQRSTWDAILTSPLEGREIIVAKVGGSLFAMRWLAGALLLAWTASLAVGGMGLSTWLTRLVMLSAGGAFMAAIGVGIGLSLKGAHTTRGMAAVVALWMAAAVASAVLAWLLSMVVFVLGLLLWATYALSTSSSMSAGPSGAFTDWLVGGVFFGLRATLYLGAAVLTIGWIAARFDRLAGRLGGVTIGRKIVKSWKSLNEPLPPGNQYPEDVQVIEAETASSNAPEPDAGNMTG